ncbi:MAG: LLM class flavin-dependent oxidoreductase [Gaiellaceae bacterium]
MITAEIELFSTCPQSRGMGYGDGAPYLRQVAKVARWSERAGCRGMLIYTDNALVDPWLVAQHVIQSTEHLCPLVAVQPLYMHPYSAAKMIASLGFIHERQLYVNLVAGGFVNDLKALADETDHDDRYRRLVEYGRILSTLIESESAYSFDGEFYEVHNLTLSPRLPPDLRPLIFVSGSSPAGMAAGRKLGATAVKYPQRAEEEVGLEDLDETRLGMRIGILARPNPDEAWRAAVSRFPLDRRGQITHKLAMLVSDSHWHRNLSDLGSIDYSDEHPYWLRPFENYKTFCPYLVGSYDRVGEELRRYIAKGFRTFILDIPQAEEDFVHIAAVFEAASAPRRQAGAGPKTEQTHLESARVDPILLPPR